MLPPSRGAVHNGSVLLRCFRPTTSRRQPTPRLNHSELPLLPLPPKRNGYGRVWVMVTVPPSRCPFCTCSQHGASMRFPLLDCAQEEAEREAAELRLVCDPDRREPSANTQCLLSQVRSRSECRCVRVIGCGSGKRSRRRSERQLNSARYALPCDVLRCPPLAFPRAAAFGISTRLVALLPPPIGICAR